MLDSTIRRQIDPWLDRGGRLLASKGISANAVTGFGLVLGLLSALLIVLEAPVLVVLALLLASRLCDGLDGAVAKVAGRSDLGGYLDIVFDFTFYGAIPLAFAFKSPETNALASACLLLAFYVNGTTFLAFAAIAAKRGLSSPDYGSKSIIFSVGLTEATETIAVFIAMIIWQAHFAVLAYVFSAMCLVSATARVFLAVKLFR